MSSNPETEKSVGNEAKVIAITEHAGTLVEQITCSTATALADHLLKCNREGKRIFPGRPVRLPENPAQRVDYFLTLTGAETIIEHSRPDQVISVQAGISISALQALLAQNKQWFPVCLPDENISLMEYINNGSSGPLEQGYGEARDLVLGMQVVLGTGELIKCGGKVVKNVTGYDLPKLFAGAHGTLCIPFSAHLRLYALPETAATIVLHFKNAESAFQVARLLRASGLPLSCLEIVDAAIFQLLDVDKRPAPFVSVSRDEILLCVQIHGAASVVAELENELGKIGGQRASSQEKLEGPHEQQLWKFLAEPACFLQAEWLELSGPTLVIEKLLAELKDKQKSSLLEGDFTMSWTARPGRNKALLVLGYPLQGKFSSGSHNLPSDTLRQLTSDLANRSAAHSSQITVAYADDNYLWHVRHLPKDDLVLNELKHRVKYQYDPRGILNPLASL